MAGRDLTRQSSFDRMMSLVAAADNHPSISDRNKAATELQLFWIKYKKISQTIGDIRSAKTDVMLISGKLTAVKSNMNDFAAVRNILSDSAFVTAVNSFLSSLPLDPSLKAKNSTARSSHTIGSALFIHYFPHEVLLDDEEADLSREAEECSLAAEMLVRNLHKFISNCVALTSPAESNKTAAFKQSMLSYRFSVRYFIEKLEQWKELDASRLLQSLESPYLESYTMFFSLSKIVNATNAIAQKETASNSVSVTSVAVTGQAVSDSGSSSPDNEAETNLIVYKAAEQQCSKIKQAMFKILGVRAQAKIEELNAQVEAAFSDDPIGQLKADIEGAGSTGIRRIENSDTASMAPATADSELEATATATPAGFQDISLILKRIGAAGGFGASPPAANGPSPVLPSDEFRVGNECHQLLHELCLDPTYRLPEAPSPRGVDLKFYSQYYLPSPPSNNITTGGWTHMIQSPSYPRSPNLVSAMRQQDIDAGVAEEAEEGNSMESNMSKLKDKIKASMLFMMDDNIVCSLSSSPISESGLRQIAVGAVIPVLYNIGDTAMILSARVIAVHRDSDSTGGSVGSVDVEYICDSTVERGVMLGRVKVSGDAPSPTPFLLALQEILNRIGGLTPNRADLHAELTASVDFQLWMQMLSHQAMTARDVSAIFAHVFSCISKLQAPVRSEPFAEWTSEYLRLIASSSTFEAVIPLLPLVFEFAGAAIDEIRRDIANYHVTTLAPLLRSPLGPSYLSHRIMQSLLSSGTMPGRGASLDNTMSLLVSLLCPVQRQGEVIAELLEATGETVDLKDLGRHTPATESTTTLAPASSSAASAPPNTSSKVSVRKALVAISMLRLLQLPVRLTSPSARAQVLPETFLFDGPRLSIFRDLVDIISVQALQKIGLLSSEAEETTLYNRLNVLLRDTSVGMKSIVAESVRFVRTAKENSRTRVTSLPASDTTRSISPLALRYQSLSTTTTATTTQAPSTGRPRSPVSPARASRNAEYESTGSEWEEALEKSLKNVLADGNPVLHLFTKRIYKVLLRAMLGQPYLAKLPSLSLHAKGIQRNMSELIARAVKLFTVHSGVYEEVYSMIFASYTFTHYVFPEAEIDVD